MRLKKILFEKDVVVIKWEAFSKETGVYNEMGIKVHDKPKPSFDQAIQDLQPHLISICEIETLNKKLVHATGISIVYKGEHDVMSIKITGFKTFNNSNGSMPLTSPAKEASNPMGKGTAAENLLTKKAIDICNHVIDQAKAFMKGDRIYIDMFSEENAPPPKEKTESKNEDLLNPTSKSPAKKSEKKTEKKSAKKQSKKTDKKSTKPATGK